MNTLFDTLATMGFVARRDRMAWGTGSYFAWGTAITVAHEGKGYKVAYHSWGYDQYGDLVFDEKSERWLRRHGDVIALVAELKRK